MAFRIGQKVVCVDARARISLYRAWIYNDAPVEGRVYTISAIVLDEGEDCLVLLEHPRSPRSQHSGFAARRFRPVVERKTDISIFTKMLKPSKVDA